MKRTGANRKGRMGEKTNLLMWMGVAVWVIGLLRRLPFLSLFGENGMGYFASVNEVRILATLFITVGMAETVRSMVKYRMKREQYKGAQRIFQCALFLAVVFGIAAGAFLILLSGFTAEIVFLEPFSKLAVSVMAPAILFISLTSILRGYFQGTGTQIPTVHSLLLEQILMTGLGMLFAILFQRQGEKVAAVLQTKEFAASYGVMGACVGILLASVLSFLHLLFIYLLYSGTVKRQIYKDNSRSLDSKGYLYGSLLLSSLPYGILGVLYHLNTLLDQRLYYYFRNIDSQNNGAAAADKAELWGNYYGVYLVIIGILAAVGSLLPRKAIPAIALAWNRDEKRAARDLLMETIHQCILILVPVTILTGVLAESIGKIFSQSHPDISAALLRWGSPLIVLWVLGYLCAGLLKQFQKILPLLLIGGGGLLLHLGVIYFLLSKMRMGIPGVALSNVISGFGMLAAAFLMVSRILQYRKEWLLRSIRTLAVTLVCGGITGLIALLLHMALVSLVGHVLTVLLCLVIALPVYLVLMTLFRGLGEKELASLPGGGVFLKIAKAIQGM